MSFIKKDANRVKIEDNVFAIVNKAKQDIKENGADKVIDATIGSLYDEEGNLVALKSVFDSYNAIDNRIKAAYASSFTGNPDFRQQVDKWLFADTKLNLKRSVLATPGGTGAIAMSMRSCLEVNDTVLLPEIAWGSYKLMAQEYGYQVESYHLFTGEQFNLTDFKEKCLAIVQKQHKLFVVINSPCHNPTGYSLTIDEWKQVINILNECSSYGPTILLNDIAYLDYSYDLNQVHQYFNCFNDINDQVAIVVAFSSSKTLTSYGIRVGAAVLLAKQAQDVEEMETVMEKYCRSTWSNCPNAGMKNFVLVTTTYLDDFMQEKAKYIELLKKRSSIIVKEAKQVGLPIYPYKEGFFVTIRVDDNQLNNRFHQALMDHHIYTVKVNKGIRIACCSIPVNKAYGLAKQMKDILDTITK